MATVLTLISEKNKFVKQMTTVVHRRYCRARLHEYLQRYNSHFIFNNKNCYIIIIII